MKYRVYYLDEPLGREARIFEKRNCQELEKFLSEIEGHGLTFRDEAEAGAVFFAWDGVDVGFYLEED